MNKFYAFISSLVRVFVGPLYPMKYLGRENIPEGPAIVCANHSSYLDPILVSFAFTARKNVHFMAKADLFDVPVIGPVIRGVGAFPVVRGTSDVSAIRNSMKYLRQGEKIMMFPEGKRVPEDDAQAVKTGAVRIALKLGVPIIPMYIPRKKRLFKRDEVIIGKPYHVDNTQQGGDYNALSKQLLDKISELGTDRI